MLRYLLVATSALTLGAALLVAAVAPELNGGPYRRAIAFEPAARLDSRSVAIAVRYMQSWRKGECDAAASFVLFAAREPTRAACRENARSERRSELTRFLLWSVLDASLRRDCSARFNVIGAEPSLLVVRPGTFDCVEIHQEGLRCEPNGKTVLDEQTVVFLARRYGHWVVAYSDDPGGSGISTIEACNRSERQRFKAGIART